MEMARTLAVQEEKVWTPQWLAAAAGVKSKWVGQLHE